MSCHHIFFRFQVSVMSLMCISFNRYLNVCHPQILSKIVTLRRTVISCLLCWIISLIVVMPLVIPDDDHKQHLGYNIKSHTCTFDKNRDDIYEYGRAVMLIMTYLPLFFVGYWNFSIFRKWRRKRMTTASKYPTIEREQRRRERVVIAWRTNSVNISARNNTESVQNGHEKYTKISIDELSQSPPVEDSQSKGAQSEQTDPRSQAQANRDCKATPLSPVIKRLRDSKTHLSHDKSLSNHLQQLHRRALKRRAAERALVRSLFVVFILMFAAFVPFSIINTVNITEDISPEISITGDLMLFFNNAVNWIVYGVMNRSFKRAYLKSLRNLCCICCKRPTNPSTDHTSVSLQSNVNTAVILKSVEEPTSSSEDDANVTFEQGDHDVSSTYF